MARSKELRRTVEEIYKNNRAALAAIRMVRERAERAARHCLEHGIADRSAYDLTPYGVGRVAGILDLRCPACGAPVGALCERRGRPGIGGCDARVRLARAFYGRPCGEVPNGGGRARRVAPVKVQLGLI